MAGGALSPARLLPRSPPRQQWGQDVPTAVGRTGRAPHLLCGPKIRPGQCRASGRHCMGTPTHAGPYLAPPAASSLRWWQSCGRRGGSEGEQQRGGCTAPSGSPLLAAFGSAGASTKQLLQALGPSPGGTSLAAVPQGTRWALVCPHPTPCTYPVPRECPQKRMLLFPLRAFAQS